jgi:hypothetical protein
MRRTNSERRSLGYTETHRPWLIRVDAFVGPSYASFQESIIPLTQVHLIFKRLFKINGQKIAEIHPVYIYIKRFT